MPDSPFFSVVTPSWNQGRYLSSCLESVCLQAEPSVEHLIIDNCSTDETADVVRRFPHCRFISEPDSGQSQAINKGFRMAQGEVICWLNSDDAYPEGLFTLLRQRFSDPKVQVIFGDVLQVAYDGRQTQICEARFENREDMVRWWSSAVRLHQPAIFFRRSVCEETGPLREDLHYAMDYEYWWRMSERHRFVHVPEVLAIQHRQPESKTIRNWEKVYLEREQIFQPHYGMIDQGDLPALLREKRTAMSQRYLQDAYAAVNEPVAALRLLGRSLLEDPKSALSLRWLGLMRRLPLAMIRS